MYAGSKIICRVATHLEKITHIEKYSHSVLNLEPIFFKVR